MIAISPVSNEPGDDVVLVVRNTHSPECGEPPRLQHPTAGIYVGAFVGAYGDLWAIEIDRKAKTGVLRGGDIGWDTEITIKKNRIGGGVILGEEEFGVACSVLAGSDGRYS